MAWWNVFRLGRRRRKVRRPAGVKWLVAGLGNPGPEYASSRHNFGFISAEALVAHYGGQWSTAGDAELETCRLLVGDGTPVQVIRPLAFMNRSGYPVRRALQQAGLDSSRLIVLVDDLALPLGSLRIREGGGDGGHNGLRSVAECLGNGTFIRVRLGVAPDGGMPPASEWVDFVLGSFDPEEQEQVRQVARTAVSAVADIVSQGPSRAMGCHNRRPRTA